MNKFDLDQQESLSPRGYIVDSYPIVTKNAEIRCSTQNLNFHHQRKPALLTNKYSNQKYLTTRLIDGHNPNNKLSNNNNNQNNVNHNSEITKNSKNSSNNNYFHYSQNIDNNNINNNSISTKKNHNSDLQNLSENIRNLSLPSNNNNDHDIIKIDKFQRETQISRLAENNRTTFKLIDRNGISGGDVKVNVDDEVEIDVDGSSNEDEDDEILPVIGV